MLRGIFLLRRSELDWFYQDELGAASLFPDLWEKYVALIPPRERGNMMRAYYRRLTSKNVKVRTRAAYAWSIWEGATSYLQAKDHDLAQFSDPDIAAAFARIGCHYFVHRCFRQREDQLLRGVRKIRHIPAVIVQGRYDAGLPDAQRLGVTSRWPEADLRISVDAGHSHSAGQCAR